MNSFENLGGGRVHPPKRIEGGSSTPRVKVKHKRNAPIELASLSRNDTLKLTYAYATYATLGRRKSFSQVPKGIW